MKIAVITFWKDISVLIPKLGGYDAIFSCEQTAVNLLAEGIRLEAIISDFDSISQDGPTLEQIQAETQVMVLPEEKDETDGHALLQYAKQKYPGAKLDVFNQFDTRVDHALAHLSFFYTYDNMTLYTPKTKIKMVKAGNYDLKQSSAYRYISFICLTQIEGLSIIGLKYELRNQIVQPFSDLLVSNEYIAGMSAKLIFEKGELLIIYSND
ncbi:thiamine pyrophosphokinase [Erysipelotrichaceae bacterium]|nr:thiamine pyrophosphokinase [Erysipelotrichaceae bacterium]